MNLNKNGKREKYLVALYLRLSRDEKRGQLLSLSIENQKDLLTRFVSKNNWTIYDIYIDDGYSGANFDRPDFQRMLNDIEAGHIDCVITKDLERLGRNYVKAGYYTEEFFLEKGVRFIALNDEVDTEGEDNDFTPFKHVVNEYYPKQVSKKVRQVKKSGAVEGKYMGSHAPFGYQKSSTNKHELIIDDESALIVQKIFQAYAAGDSGRMIADHFNDEGVDTPRFYYYKKTGKSNPNCKEKNVWGSGTIMQILKNEVYIGNLVQGKREVISFKTKKRRVVDSEKWIRVEGTHDAIIDETLWKSVHDRLKSNRRVRKSKNQEPGLFAGKLICAECGAPLAFTTDKWKTGERRRYRCSRYNNKGANACSTHSINEELLTSIVLEDIQRYSAMAANEYDSLKKRILQSVLSDQNVETGIIKKKIAEKENRLTIVSDSLKNLYIDKCSNKIPESLFLDLMSDFSLEKEELTKSIIEQERRLQEIEGDLNHVSEWMTLIERQLHIKDLTRVAVMELIDSIEISEYTNENGEKDQSITIHYRFVGNINEKEKRDIA